MANVLIVLDGSYRFTAAGVPAGTADFTYSALLDALAGHAVTKAHRQSDSSAHHQNFNFATPPPGVSLLDFDVMWLIANQGRNHTFGGTSIKLPDPELKAIARAMAAGVGVFATGDHDSIGSNMCGHIPRVRAMRGWYGPGDPISPMPAAFPRNFLPVGAARADTTRRNPGGDYGGDMTFVWFENQSDSLPQPMTPATSPPHPILRRGGADIIVFPDHMHEGNTFGDVNAPDPNYPGAAYAYDQSIPLDGESFAEFPMVAGHRELPKVIATVQTTTFASKYVGTGQFVDMNPAVSVQRPVNALSVYDGRVAGVGRIVTGSTFHHYVDINLTGDSGVTPALSPKVGPNAEKNHGFNDAPAVFADIKRAFANITDWLARPRPKIQIILERSTFSQAEAMADSTFEAAILVVVDGLKPNQFPGPPGGITSLADAAFNPAWAPAITIPFEPAGLTITPVDVDSDDMVSNDRVQRITFKYDVQVNAAAAFAFMDPHNHVQINASLTSAAVSAPLTDTAQITLVKSANPFMLDLVAPNTTPWLSSDVRVFPIVAGAPGSPLPDGATRGQAFGHLVTLLNGMNDAQFDAIPSGQAASALSPFATTTGSPSRLVYNFAVARVRLPASGAPATGVRVFFRIFTTQTTAALTYSESPPGTPVEGYKKRMVGAPIALPGTNAAGNDWISFPMFAEGRAGSPDAQNDGNNVKNMSPGVPKFFGCLIDNNLSGDYLPTVPGGMTNVPLPTLMMGEHPCIVAQIEFPGTPIANGANPFTSDKLAQRNIALSGIANPGLDASRSAIHTFEIEATPLAISEASPPDELLIEWHTEAPDGTEVRLHIPGWNARDVIELADRFYPRHEIRAIDSDTIALPGGGTRYVPVPAGHQRRTGVIVASLPLGVTKGQRFDLSVRQITTRGRQVDPPPPTVTAITREEAARLVAGLAGGPTGPEAAEASVERGVFSLGDNRVLITDLRVMDAQGDHAVIVEQPEPEAVEAAMRESGRWRETIGAFQLGIPVSTKADLLGHHLRLLSVLRWRAGHLRPNSRWHATFVRYVELTADKVRALGGDPWKVPATPDGAIPLPDGDGGDSGGGFGGGDRGEAGMRVCLWCWLLVLLLLILLIVALWALG